MGLPASPAIVLGNIAKSQKKDCVLVIDQLDAVSLVSGRNPQFFDCITEIINECSIYPNVHLLLACRKFNFENDFRIQGLTKKTNKNENQVEPRNEIKIVAINHLLEFTVKNIVQGLGIDANRLDNKQLELLSIPLHLRLFAEIAKDSTVDVLTFETAKDLFSQYWDYKQRELRKRLSRSIQWTQVIDKLCDYMSSKQSLSAPQSIVDEYSDDTSVMISEHILVKEGSRLRFFHESFFDYAFARRFAARGQKVISLLQNSEQHLFRRAQVRQILLHERDVNFEQYLNDVNELLNSSNIRFHIKQVVLALLSTFTEPKKEEWKLIAPLIEDSKHLLTQQVWQRLLYRSTSWFQLLDSFGVLEKWLKDEKEIYIEKTMSLLWSMQGQLPERVAELIKPFVGASDVWNNRLVHFIQSYTELYPNRRFFEFFLRLVDEGILYKDRNKVVYNNNDFWGLIDSTDHEHKSWTCEVIGHYLNQCLKLYLIRLIFLFLPYLYSLNINACWLLKFSQLNVYVNPFSNYRDDLGTIYDTQHTSLFRESADKAPHSFFSFVFPFMLCVIELTAEKEGEPPWLDRVWEYRTYGKVYGIEDALLNAMEIALSNLAKDSPKEFSEFVKQLRPSRGCATKREIYCRSCP